jgi:hypothetical protein
MALSLATRLYQNTGKPKRLILLTKSARKTKSNTVPLNSSILGLMGW